MFFRLLSIALLGCLSATSFAQGVNVRSLSLDFGGPNRPPAADDVLTVSAELVAIDETSAELQVTAELQDGYYIYPTNPGFGTATQITLTNTGGLTAAGGEFVADHEPKVVFDDILKLDIEKYFGTVTWTRRLTSTNGPLKPGISVEGELTGQYCSSGEGGVCVQITPARQFTATLSESTVSAPATTRDNVAAPERTSGNGDAADSQSRVTIIPDVKGDEDEKSPIEFTISLTPADASVGDEVTLSVTANIARPWHTYSLTQDAEQGGGQPTEILLDEVTGLQAIGTDFTASEKPEIEEPLEGFVLETHYDHVTWSRPFVLTDEQAHIAGTVIFQICNNGSCLPPADFEFRVSLGTATTGQIPAVPGPAGPDVLPETQPTATETDAALAVNNPAKDGLWAFLLTAVVAGYVALLTPCVFPMIPVTVSFFLKQGETGKDNTLRLAIVYCLGIVGTFTVLGLLTATFFGGEALNQLANNPWLNLFFALVFTLFAMMLLGMFELRVPSWLLTWSAKRESTGGIVGVLFMALTFTLVSFTCTFAFVGTLLVVAAKGSYFWPIIGMLAFSTAFASPFFFLALFPGMLKKLPKSGGWMNRVKVTLGLLELAIVAKFLSVADIGFSATQTPYLLDFSLVVGAWIAVAVVTGLYLLGMFSIGHDDNNRSTGPLQAVFALTFIGIGVYMAVGLFAREEPKGIVWQQIAAFAPPTAAISETDNGYFLEHDGLQYALEFDTAVEQARGANKPIFVDFTGVNCINCRVMERTALRTPKVHEVISDLPRAQLYVDTVPGVEDAARSKQILNRNIDLQKSLFGDVAIPAYAIVSPDGTQILARFTGLDTSGEKFRAFLDEGLNAWRQRSGTSGARATTTGLVSVH
ncbi:MAG: protein-disulfide reductase DsbD family protein [Planctomycetaceae bacterium]